MSWYGKHPFLTKDTVRRFAPPSACKECIYWLRLLDVRRSYEILPNDNTCPRCGTRRGEIEYRMIAELCPKRKPRSTRS